jgi:hypothetical protein
MEKSMLPIRKSVISVVFALFACGSGDAMEISSDKIVFDHRGLYYALPVHTNVLLEPSGENDTLRITASQRTYTGVVTLHQDIKCLVCQGSDTLPQKIVTLNPERTLELEFTAAPSGVVYTNVIQNFQKGAIKCRFIVGNGNKLEAGGSILGTNENGCVFSTTAF